MRILWVEIEKACLARVWVSWCLSALKPGYGGIWRVEERRFQGWLMGRWMIGEQGTTASVVALQVLPGLEGILVKIVFPGRGLGSDASGWVQHRKGIAWRGQLMGIQQGDRLVGIEAVRSFANTDSV